MAETGVNTAVVAFYMALGGGWPAACTTHVWRDCIMSEGRVDVLRTADAAPK